MNPLCKARHVLAVIAVILLPSLAVAAVTLPYVEEAKSLATESMAVWFLVLAGIAIVSWSFIVRWLLQQLESQRAANSELTNKLIGFMATDHAESTRVMQKAVDVMGAVLEELKKR